MPGTGDDLALHQALSHPMRVRILTALNTPTRRLSPRQFADSINEEISNVSYHFRTLVKLGMIEEVGHAHKRGAVEHFYEPRKKALAWSKDWAELPEAIKDSLTATALRAFVEETGSAIDAGTFAARDDSILAWDKMWVTESGWQRMIALWASTLLEAMKIEEDSKREREEGAGGFFMSYGIAAFESPPPPEPA